MADEAAVSRFLALNSADDDTGADIIAKYGKLAIDKWIKVGRAVISDDSPKTFAALMEGIREIPANQMNRELVEGCLSISKYETSDEILAKLSETESANFAQLQEIFRILNVKKLNKLNLLAAVKKLVRKGYSEIFLIDLVILLASEADFSMTLEIFKILNCLGNFSDEHLQMIRDRGSVLRKLSRKFPMPSWLNVVAWNL